MITEADGGLRQAFISAVVAGGFLLLGKGADWLIKRRAERRTLTVGEQGVEIGKQGVEDDRLEGIADRFRELAVAERTRAEQIAMERDTMARDLNAKIDRLAAQVATLQEAVQEKDGIIARQAAKIERLERRVGELERHERAHKTVEGKMSE